MSFWRRACCAALLAAGAATLPVRAEPLPAATEAMLKDLKLEASLLDGTQEELRVPDAWTEGAKTEAPVILYDTTSPKDWQRIYQVFTGRYPSLKIEHSQVNTSARRFVLPLTAYKEGRILVDVIAGLSGNSFLFREADALEDLSVLPNYKKLPAYGRQPDHITMGSRIQYWCMSYNTDKVKAAELPRDWDDLVASDRFADGRLMLGNRPNDWLLYVWHVRGDEWGRKFTQSLFERLHPQFRKEGLNALVKLTALGEGEITVPQAMPRVGDAVRAGAPVGYHCPEPVPFVLTEMGLMKHSPRSNGAKIFMNWILSKEGQIAQFWANGSTPAREDLHDRRFLDFPDAVAGKQMVTLPPDPAALTAKVAAVWDGYWLKEGAEKSGR
jgi:ABC-type Fe3+ transport system substrate-binding protein